MQTSSCSPCEEPSPEGISSGHHPNASRAPPSGMLKRSIDALATTGSRCRVLEKSEVDKDDISRESAPRAEDRWRGEVRREAGASDGGEAGLKGFVFGRAVMLRSSVDEDKVVTKEPVWMRWVGFRWERA